MTDTRVQYEQDGRTYQVFVPEGFEGRPETGLDAVKRARAAIAEEGRWMMGQWFDNPHPDLDWEDAFCNNWMVCVDGALVIATIGLERKEYDWQDGVAYCWQSPHQEPVAREDTLLAEARNIVLKGAEERFPKKFRQLRARSQVTWDEMTNEQRLESGATDADSFFWRHLSIPGFNDSDCKSRTDALTWLDKAIELAETQEATV